MVLDTISEPTLLLDPVRCQRNIDRIARKTQEQQVLLRTHFKTHQSHQIGEWFRQRGLDKITVSSVGMARYFTEAGWKDITIAFPVNIRQIPAIRELTKEAMLGLVVVDEGAVERLGKALSLTVRLWIKIDVGTHRTGISPDDVTLIDRILERIRRYPQLNFAGFLAHAGHSYRGHTLPEAEHTYGQSVASLSALRQRYMDSYPDLQISLGDTPGVSMVRDLRGPDELRPGNFVFYDLMQVDIGSCSPDDIAVALACPVVAVHPERYQWIIYGGGIHFSKDFLQLKNGEKCFGRMARIHGNAWSTDNLDQNPYLISLSQEHGVVQCTPENFSWCVPGDLSLWLPVHSCMTADTMGEYLTTEGKWIDHFRKRSRK